MRKDWFRKLETICPMVAVCEFSVARGSRRAGIFGTVCVKEEMNGNVKY